MERETYAYDVYVYLQLEGYISKFHPWLPVSGRIQDDYHILSCACPYFPHCLQ